MRGHEVYLALTVAALVLIATRRWSLPRGRTAVLIAAVVTLGFLRLDLPSVHCIVEGLLDRLDLEFLKGSMVVKLALAFGLAPLVGRVFCGYVCPKGAAQELIFIRRWRLRVPRRLDRVLRLGPYLTLAAIAAAPHLIDRRIWADWDPFRWVFQAHGHLIGLGVLAVVAALSLVLMRPFCRYLCPLVPIFRLLSRLAPARRRVELDRCRGCKSGQRACDWDLVDLKPAPRPDGRDKPSCHFDAAECLQCGRCAGACPREAIR